VDPHIYCVVQMSSNCSVQKVSDIQVLVYSLNYIYRVGHPTSRRKHIISHIQGEDDLH
jgi:hypothetical protein